MRPGLITIIVLAGAASTAAAQSVCADGQCQNAFRGQANGASLYPFSAQITWLHGAHQQLAGYHGYHSFRPYNYRHVGSQAGVAVRFGEAYSAPYSHAFAHRSPQTASRISPASWQAVRPVSFAPTQGRKPVFVPGRQTRVPAVRRTAAGDTATMPQPLFPLPPMPR